MNHGLELSKLLAGYIALGCAALLQASPAQAGDPNDVANFRAGRSCMRCDLRYENYAGIVVHGADLRGVYMLSVNLSNARLLGAQMRLEKEDEQEARDDEGMRSHDGKKERATTSW